MKTLVKTQKELRAAGRCDIDYHLPPELIKKFPLSSLKRVGEVADVSTEKVDPQKSPEETFTYIDISCVDIISGQVGLPQELLGLEAPSRARKLVKEGDIIISTCRPTRGAIALIQEHNHGDVCSTGFSVIRPKKAVLNEYLHWALRLPSTLEQFRKWSTGSSYPAILDEDVEKTLIPYPDKNIQSQIVTRMRESYEERKRLIEQANSKLNQSQSWAEIFIEKTAPK